MLRFKLVDLYVVNNFRFLENHRFQNSRLVTTKLSMQLKFCYDLKPNVWHESGV